MGNNTWNNTLDPFVNSRGTAKNTFTALQEVAGVVGQQNSLPYTAGGELKLGSKVELEAWGEYTCATGITLAVAFLYNATPGGAAGTTLALSGTLTSGTTPTAWPWHIQGNWIVTGIGAAGANSVMYGQGIADMNLASLILPASSNMPITAALRSVSFDSTIRASWGVGWVWGTSGAGNTVTVDQFTVKVVNQGKPS